MKILIQFLMLCVIALALQTPVQAQPPGSMPTVDYECLDRCIDQECQTGTWWEKWNCNLSCLGNCLQQRSIAQFSGSTKVVQSCSKEVAAPKMEKFLTANYDRLASKSFIPLDKKVDLSSRM